MRKRIAKRRDTLDEKNLPRGARAETVLNHRTQLTTPTQDTWTTMGLMTQQAATVVLLVLLVRLLAGLEFKFIGVIFVPLIVWNLASAFIKYLYNRTTWPTLTWVGIFGIAWALFLGLSHGPSSIHIYLYIFGPAVLVSVWLSHYIAKQFAYWMSVNIRLENDAVERWQDNWRLLLSGKTPVDCPELESYRASLLIIPVAFGLGFLALRNAERGTYADFSGLIGIAAFVGACFFFLAMWSVFGPTYWMSPGRIYSSAWRALTNWYCYNAHQTTAPGVFQFPTIWFRPTANRYLMSWVVFFLLSLTVTQLASTAFVKHILLLGDVFTTSRDTWGGFHAEDVEKTLTQSERLWYQRLPEIRKEAYLKQVYTTRLNARKATLPSGSNAYIFRVVLFLVAMFLIPIVLLVTVLVTLSGRLLTAYYDALEAPDAWEVKDGYWPWDNKVSRILNSPFPLEREHLYLGRSAHGDYPIYLHRSLLHAHAHILGDSGSRKTSIGIAPLMTQLIARADSSILIIDLKGDKGLFECARDEAEAAGLPFRFFTNIPGRTSHVFNPLKQSHTDTLTVNQRVQSILQALSLDYGEHYGASYFSAMNEIVLKSYLAHYTKIQTFHDLYGYVKEEHAYRATGGQKDDWKEARHLAVLLDKLASVYPLNLSNAQLSEQPRAITEQIDMPSLLKEKQVVYFYLSSAIEPTTVSPIARLAMFNLLTAAAQVEGKANRVYVFIDEFQRVITENVKLFLEQARSMKLHFILANQTMGQLKGRDLDLTDTIESCTAYKQMFKASDLNTLKRIEEASGEALYHQLSWKGIALEGFTGSEEFDYNDTSPGIRGIQETTGPRLERNTLIELSAASWMSLVRFTEGSGFTQFSGYFTPLIHEYHIHEEFYQERCDRPWPEPDGKTVSVLIGKQAAVEEAKPAQPAPPTNGSDTSTPPAVPTPPSSATSIADRLAEDAASL